MMLSKIKYWLGMKVVMPVTGGSVITKRNFFMRTCKSAKGAYWWCSPEHWAEYCVFKTRNDAEQACKNFF